MSLDVKEIVEACQKKYGSKLLGGNCGMFALALGSFLEYNHISSNVIIYSDYPEEEYGAPKSASEISATEPDVYHIALECNVRTCI